MNEVFLTSRENKTEFLRRRFLSGLLSGDLIASFLREIWRAQMNCCIGISLIRGGDGLRVPRCDKPSLSNFQFRSHQTNNIFDRVVVLVVLFLQGDGNVGFFVHQYARLSE